METKFYSLHLSLKNEKDGIYSNIPLYFNTVTDFEEGKRNFFKACNQLFKDGYKLTEYPQGHYSCSRFVAVGEIGKEIGGVIYGPNYCGKFMLELSEFSHKPADTDNI